MQSRIRKGPLDILHGRYYRVLMVTPRIDTKNGSQPDPVKISRGIFGATVGIDRLLGLLDQHDIKGSWFIPAHTVESFPVQIAKVREAGHEMYGTSTTHYCTLSTQPPFPLLPQILSVLNIIS